ncbi:hypothetical protein IWT5_01206 [Secundilactobacillus silagincola]|uniref:Antitoxin n=1 Tax=Secundilactobacillus silagincola TaxID=1714681 RepID=A0A1Z5J1X9_9LACO|nr:hypothetical protein [Secundilactobacillus silagincola]GAX08055.1 hypothetical protein IWT5_01206 [Secundilactobacillus silagincola]
MDTYTLSNFYKHQRTIFETLDKAKKPIEITTVKTKSNGANKGYVLMSKDVYQQLIATQDKQLRQAELDIRSYALNHNPKVPANKDEMEKWLSKD